MRINVFCLGLHPATPQVIYGLFTRLANAKYPYPVWQDTIQPVVRQMLSFVESSLGPAHKLSFSITHVLLMAIALILITYLDRIRAAVLAAGRRS